MGGEIFRTRSRPALGPTQPPVQRVPGTLQEEKQPGRGADPSPTSKLRGHERVGLYLYSPSGPQWPVIGRNLQFIKVPIFRTVNCKAEW